MFALSKLSKLFTRSAAPPFDDLGSFSVFFPWPILAYLGLSWPILAYLGLSWPILAYLGLVRLVRLVRLVQVFWRGPR